MLKYKVESLDQVEEAYRPLYAPHDSGGFSVQLDGNSELKTALESERAERKQVVERVKTLEAQLRESQEAARNASQENARNKVDLSVLEAGWRKTHGDALAAKDAELTKLKSEYQPRIDKLKSSLETVLVDKEAIRIAAEIAIPDSASILLPHIKQRLKVEEAENGEPATVYLDGAGKPMSLADFVSQLSNDPRFARVIIGPKASGGGAGGSQRSSAPKPKTMTRDSYNALSLADRNAFMAGGGTLT